MSTSTSPATLQIRAIDASTLRRIRSQGQDDFGHRLERRIDHEGGEPLRCCLRYSRPGDSVVLIAYAPVRASAAAPGPYDEVGPLFIHADECEGPAESDRYPAEWVDRPQVLRAYNADGGIMGGVALEPGDDRDAAARRLLADPDIAFVHSRNIVYGCFMLEIRRA